MSNAWLVRPFPHNENRIKEFVTKNIVAIGWPGIGNLSGSTREQIKSILSKPPYKLESLMLGNAYATVDLFVNKINVNDLVLVPNGSDIHLGVISSEYIYDSNYDNDQEGFPHQRKIDWLKTVQRKILPMDLRTSLKVHRTAADLSKYYEVIKALAYGTNMPVPSSTNSNSSYVSANYPLRPNVFVTINVPSDITKLESERLGDFIKTLYFK